MLIYRSGVGQNPHMPSYFKTYKLCYTNAWIMCRPPVSPLAELPLCKRSCLCGPSIVWLDLDVGCPVATCSGRRPERWPQLSAGSGTAPPALARSHPPVCPAGLRRLRFRQRDRSAAPVSEAERGRGEHRPGHPHCQPTLLQ